MTNLKLFYYERSDKYSTDTGYKTFLEVLEAWKDSKCEYLMTDDKLVIIRGDDVSIWTKK